MLDKNMTLSNSTALLLWLIVIAICTYLILGFFYEIYIPIITLAILSLTNLKKHKLSRVFVIIVSIAIPVIFYFAVSYRFNHMKPEILTNLPSHMIWAHRGYTQGFAENSLDSFDAARRMGYYGIELDIYFLEGKGFVVIHDLPKKTLNDQKYLLLETVFDRYKKQFYYWLDFKNLSKSNAHASGEFLSKYKKLYGLNGHIFVESTNADALRKLKKIAPDIYTIYWLPGNLYMKPVLFITKYRFLCADVDMVSMPEQYVSDVFFNNFSHLNMAIYTVNNPDRVDYYFRKGARVILSDIDMRHVFPEAYKHTKK